MARTDEQEIGRLREQSTSLETEQAQLQTVAAQQLRQETELAQLRTQVEQDLARLNRLRQQVGETSRRAPPAAAQPPPPPPPTVGAAAKAVAFAYAQINKPYAWGADGPDSYDCSGLTSAAWRAAGVSLPHNAARQFSAMVHVSRGQLVPGDLVFYYRDITHVALYVGNNLVVHAPTSGQRVRVQNMELAPVTGFGRPS